jgi:uncharacterized protein YndB with AHSA1/START domain
LRKDRVERIERSVVLAVSPAEAWAAVSTPDRLSRWFAPCLELELRPGGRATFVDDGEVRRALVEEVEPGHRLAFRWLPVPRLAPWQGRAEPRTRVELTVEGTGGGTRLTVVEEPVAGSPAGVEVLVR